MEWLRDELAKVGDIREVADRAFHYHKGGVVYALKMTSDELEGLRWNQYMGIEAARPIAASKIISKMAVPAEYEINPYAGRGNGYLARMNLGLLAALASRGH